MPVIRAAFLLLAVLFAALQPGPVCAQTSSPFGVPVEQAQQAPRAEPGPVGKLLAWVYQRQQAFHRLLTNAVKAFRTDAGAIWLLLGASFFYGVFHAAGPGHGKAVLSSYMVANETQVKRGIMLAFAAALVQALSAIAIVAVLAVLLNATSLAINATADALELASYGVIALVGLWLVYAKARAIMRSRAAAHHLAHGHDHDHGHEHDDHCGHVHMPAPERLADKLSLKEAAGLILAMGLRPCTGAVLVLIFALAQGIFYAGIGAAFAMAFGTAITVSALAALALGAKRLTLRLGGGGQGTLLHNGVELLGASLVLLLGVTLFAATLQGGGAAF